MSLKNKISLGTITGQINQTALDLLDQNPKGLRWAELAKEIRQIHPNFHPKTINGCIWKLVENFPKDVEKPEKGVFRLIKHG